MTEELIIREELLAQFKDALKFRKEKTIDEICSEVSSRAISSTVFYDYRIEHNKLANSKSATLVALDALLDKVTKMNVKKHLYDNISRKFKNKEFL